MFDKMSLTKAESILRKTFKKINIKAKFEVKENRVIATVFDIPVNGKVCNFLSVMLYREGTCFLSVVVGKTNATVENLQALNSYNGKSLCWRGYIDDENYLNFDYENYYIGKRQIKKFLRENLGSVVDNDTEEYFNMLCDTCK